MRVREGVLRVTLGSSSLGERGTGSLKWLGRQEKAVKRS